MSIYTGLRGKGLAFLLFLWFFWFLTFTGRLLFSPILPILEDEFAINHATASSLFLFASLGNALFLFLAGVFSGFVGYKKSVTLFLSVSALLFFLIPLTHSFSQLRILLFFQGMASGIYLPSALAIITRYYDVGSWGKAISIHDTGASLSVVAAPIIVVLLLQFMPWRSMFFIIGACYAVSAVVFFFIAREFKTERKFKGFVGGVFKRKSLWYLATVWVFAAGGFFALYYITPLYLTKELSFDLSYANKIFSLSRLGGVIFVLILSFFIGRYSLKKMLFIILFFTGLGSIFVGYPHPLVVQIALFLVGTLVIGFFPVGLVAVSKMFKDEERSLAAGTTSTLASLFGAGLFPYLFGLAGDHISFRFGIIIFGCLFVLASGLVFKIKELD